MPRRTPKILPLLAALALAGLRPRALPAQPLSPDFFEARNHAWLLDLGLGWEAHTLFGPDDARGLDALYGKVRRRPAFWPAADLAGWSKRLSDQRGRDEQGLLLENRFGFAGRLAESDPGITAEDFGSIYWACRAERGGLFAEWYGRAASDPAALDRFTGRPRDVKRLGLNCAEFDQASVGARFGGLRLAYGRGRQSWGPFGEENPALSSASAAYDHLSARYRYKRVTAAFFTGFLESVEDSAALQLRYIAGHGLEWSNGRNLRLSASEITVYSGPNRRFDWAYLNPLAPHLETELNDRENMPYSASNLSNAVWVFSGDWMMPGRWRASGTLVVDEFQFDGADRKRGRPDATACRLRLSKGFLSPSASLVLYAAYTRVGTYTFRHESAYGAFWSRGLPLGTRLGSDTDAWQIGLSAVLPFRVRAAAEWLSGRTGEGNLSLTPYTGYDDYTDVPFPSGKVLKTKTLALKLLYSFKPNIEIEAGMTRNTYKNSDMGSRTIYGIRLNMHFDSAATL